MITAACITFDQLEAARPRPLGNAEHATAFMKERYNTAKQLALIDENGLSQTATERFPPDRERKLFLGEPLCVVPPFRDLAPNHQPRRPGKVQRGDVQTK
jgi:hypothetical protein